MRRWLLAFLMVCMVGAGAHADEVTGVLYYMEGGSGAGMIHLYTNAGKLLHIAYFKGAYDEEGFGDTLEGWTHGAIWKVKYHMESGSPQLDHVAYTGRWNDPVHFADDVVRRHYVSLKDHRWKDAYADLSPAWHQAESLDTFVHGQQHTTFANLDDVPSYATKVIGHNSHEVLILVDAHWYIPASKDILRFTVVKSGDAWLIDRVDLLKQKDWDES